MVLGMHGALQSDLQRPVPLSAFIDNRTVAATAAALIEALELCPESEISEGPGAETRGPDGLEFFANDTDMLVKEPKRRSTALQRAAGGVQLLMLVAALLATYARRRTVDGEEFSWWRQVPAKMFQDPLQSIVPMWPKGYKALKAGFFGRQVDAYHDRWYLWFTALLPLHLATLACLFALRRMGWVRARFSQNAVTLAVSCAHIVLVHGVGCFFSFGAMLATLGVCKAGLPLAVGRPRLYKLLVWTLVLSLLALNNRLDVRTQQLFSPLLGVLPPWVYNGVRTSGSDSVVLPFGPFLAFRFLLLRLVSYCLDMGEKAHYLKGASAATARDLVSAEDFFVYVTYAPLYLHGPLVQYSSFSDQWGQRVLDSASSEKLGKKGQGAELVLKPVGSVGSAAKELAGMLGLTAVLTTLLHSVYMPTVMFYNLRSPAVETQGPVPVEHFSYAHLNFLQAFLASHTIFGLSRACAQVDGLKVNHDTPVSHFRASTSLSHHWNWFHTTWRDFFLKYIYLPLGGGYLGLLCVVAFSVDLHGSRGEWATWGFLNFLILLAEQGLRERCRWYRQPNFAVRAVNQAFVQTMHLLLFPPFVNSPRVTQTGEQLNIKAANWGAHWHFLRWNLAFAVLNNLRLGRSEAVDHLPGFW
jgi:D-alanyl-lipoteichoic acid acyltransferase DltB (MBOAT superfamily)